MTKTGKSKRPETKRIKIDPVMQKTRKKRSALEHSVQPEASAPPIELVSLEPEFSKIVFEPELPQLPPQADRLPSRNRGGQLRIASMFVLGGATFGLLYPTFFQKEAEAPAKTLIVAKADGGAIQPRAASALPKTEAPQARATEAKVKPKPAAAVEKPVKQESAALAKPAAAPVMTPQPKLTAIVAAASPAAQSVPAKEPVASAKPVMPTLEGVLDVKPQEEVKTALLTPVVEPNAPAATEKSARVVIHYGSPAVRKRAVKLRAQLVKAGTKNIVLRKVRSEIKRDEMRYFQAPDRTIAEGLESSAAGLAGFVVEQVNLGRRIKPGLVEVWLEGPGSIKPKAVKKQREPTPGTYLGELQDEAPLPTFRKEAMRMDQDYFDQSAPTQFVGPKRAKRVN